MQMKYIVELNRSAVVLAHFSALQILLSLSLA